MSALEASKIETYDLVYKILLTGDSGVGKSAILSRCNHMSRNLATIAISTTGELQYGALLVISA